MEKFIRLLIFLTVLIILKAFFWDSRPSKNNITVLEENMTYKQRFKEMTSSNNDMNDVKEFTDGLSEMKTVGGVDEDKPKVKKIIHITIEQY